MKRRNQLGVIQQRGGTFLGFIIGGVVGLLVAFVIAAYVNHVPIPFFQHDDTRTLKQDEEEAAKNKQWNPNAFLFGSTQNQNTASPVQDAVQPTESSSVVTQNSSLQGTGPTGGLPSAPPIAGSASAPASNVTPATPTTPTVQSVVTTTTSETGTQQQNSDGGVGYFLQIGAYKSKNEADAQRANLSLNGVDAKLSVVNKEGELYYRVRQGPFSDKIKADQAKNKLDGMGIVAVIVQGKS